jgi:hypothetical protein
MKTTHMVLLTVPLVLASTFARPQEPDPNARVTVDPISPVSVAMGKSTPVSFTFHIKPGFHVNSHQPTEQYLIPTEFKFSPPPDLVVAKVQYPAGVLTSFPFDPNQRLSVYSGDIAVKAVVLTSPQATAGKYTVHGELKYQACDNNACYPPKRVPVQFDVNIAKGTASGKARPSAESPHIHN